MTDRPVDLSFLKDEAVKYIDLSSLKLCIFSKMAELRLNLNR